LDNKFSKKFEFDTTRGSW